MLYHAVWLYSMIGYADSKQQIKELFKTPVMYYYSYYFLNLMAPNGMIAAFGDSRMNDNWTGGLFILKQLPIFIQILN